MKRKMDMKYWMIFSVLLFFVMGTITLGYMDEISRIEEEADEQFKSGLQNMIVGMGWLNEKEDPIYLNLISEGYGIIKASYENSKFSENEELYESIDYLNSMIMNRTNIEEILEQNNFYTIILDLRKVWSHGDEEEFIKGFKEKIRENTRVE